VNKSSFLGFRSTQHRNTGFKSLQVSVAIGIVVAGLSPTAAQSAAKQPTEVVAAKLNTACSGVTKMASQFAATDPTRAFQAITKAFTVYGVALKAISPGSDAEAGALIELRGYVTYVKSNAATIAKLLGNKKTNQAGLSRAEAFASAAGSKASAMKLNFFAVDLPLCPEALLGDSSNAPNASDGSASSQVATAAAAPTPTAAANAPSAAVSSGGRPEVSPALFPAVGGYSYQAKADLSQIADTDWQRISGSFQGYSVREVVQSDGSKFGLINAYLFNSSVDQTKRAELQGKVSAIFAGSEVASINGFRVFLGGVTQTDNATAVRGDIFLDFSGNPSEGRSTLKNFIAAYLSKIPA
jgi:hypothetical protein